MSLLGASVFGEIRRQRSDRMQLLAKIDDKKEKIDQENRRLEKRRRNYQPKNNGKGRPHKKFRACSKEDVCRRQILIAEIRLLDAVLECPRRITLEEWLRQLRRRYDGPEAVTAIETKKLDRLLAQFSGKTAYINEKRGWNVIRGQDYLLIAKLRQHGRLSAFEGDPAKTERDQALEDRERTRSLVLSKFGRHRNLPTLGRFKTLVEIMRAAPPEAPEIHNQRDYKDMWWCACEELIAQVCAAFVSDEAGR